MGTEGEANEKIRFQDRVIEIQREEVGRLGDRVRDLKSALVWHKERLDAYKSANEAWKETARQRRDRIMELESKERDSEPGALANARFMVSREVEEYRWRIEALEKQREYAAEPFERRIRGLERELEATNAKHLKTHTNAARQLMELGKANYRLRDKNTGLEMAIAKALEIAREEG